MARDPNSRGRCEAPIPRAEVRPRRAPGAGRAAAPLAGSGTIAGPVRSRPSAPNVFARIAAGKWFAAALVVVILVNAVVLGLETYSRLNARYGHVLDLVNDICLGLFVIELAIRIASYGRRPQDFFRSG